MAEKPDWWRELWREGEGPTPEQIDIYRGNGEWKPWHYIGTFTVAPGKVRPRHLSKLKARTETKQFVVHQVTAVLVSTRAINRMMGKPDEFGLDDEVEP